MPGRWWALTQRCGVTALGEWPEAVLLLPYFRESLTAGPTKDPLEVTVMNFE